LQSLNRITKNVEEVSTKVTDSASSFLDKGGPALKAVGILLSAAQMTKSRGRKKKSE